MDRKGEAHEQQMADLGPGCLLEVSSVLGRGFCSLFNSYVGLLSALEDSRNICLIGLTSSHFCMKQKPVSMPVATAPQNQPSCNKCDKGSAKIHCIVDQREAFYPDIRCSHIEECSLARPFTVTYTHTQMFWTVSCSLWQNLTTWH